MYYSVNEEYRKAYVIEHIDKQILKDKKEVRTNTIIEGASALAIGIGVLGVILFGEDTIQTFKTKDALTIANYMLVQYKGSLLIVSSLSILGGITNAIKNMKKAFISYRRLYEDKKHLKEVKRR